MIDPIIIDRDLSVSSWQWNDAVKNNAKNRLSGTSLAAFGSIMLVTESTKEKKQIDAALHKIVISFLLIKIRSTNKNTEHTARTLEPNRIE